MTQPTEQSAEQSGSKTPMTNAAEDFKTGPYDKVVPVEFARELETALSAAEARAEAEKARADKAERELAAFQDRVEAHLGSFRKEAERLDDAVQRLQSEHLAAKRELAAARVDAEPVAWLHKETKELNNGWDAILDNTGNWIPLIVAPGGEK